MSTYLEWIDTQIHKYETEITKLMIARAVVEEAAKAMTPPKAKKAVPKRPNRGSGENVNRVLGILRGLGPSTTGEIFSELVKAFPDTPRKHMHNAIYALVHSGVVVRDGKLCKIAPEQLEVAA